MRNVLALAGLIPAIGLAACATKPVPPPVVDIQAMYCPDRMALHAPIPTAFDPKEEKTTGTVLDRNALCLTAAGGARSLYQVFALPPENPPYVIAVRAIPWGDTLLAPKTVMMDQDGLVTRTSSHADFTFRGQTLSTLVRSHPEERYLAVESDPEVLGTKVSRIVGDVQQHVAATAFGAFYWYTGTDQTNNMVLTPMGRVEVTLTPLVPPAQKK